MDNQKNIENIYPKRKTGVHEPVLTGTEVPLFRFSNLEETGIVRHGFTTRLGGVSGQEAGYEHLSSLNLSFSRGDREKNVRENYRRLARELDVDENRFVFTDQTHTTNVRVVTEQDAGKGLTRERDYADVDGLITNVPGLVLSVFVADCVPVALVDPVHRAIGLVHSGWRGTVGRISARAIARMQENYGTDPADLVCAVGPSICMDCYEISADVAEQFIAEFPEYEKEILRDKKNGHYQLDLWKTNERILQDAGVPAEQIAVTSVCTCCNPDLLYSHRASHGMRGNLGAFLALKETLFS